MPLTLVRFLGYWARCWFSFCGFCCRSGNRVQLKNVHDIERDNIEQLVSAFGTVLHFDGGLCEFARYGW